MGLGVWGHRSCVLSVAEDLLLPEYQGEREIVFVCVGIAGIPFARDLGTAGARRRSEAEKRNFHRLQTRF